jgi:hypothetical protein
LTYASGLFQWYAQGAAHGILAQGGADYTKTFTGWRLKDSGSGNQYNFLTGFTVGFGDLQIAPNFLWQKPIEDPIPADVPAPGTAQKHPGRSFAVRSNRETVAGEILFTYDPTPGTWMYEWDNDIAEDAFCRQQRFRLPPPAHHAGRSHRYPRRRAYHFCIPRRSHPRRTFGRLMPVLFQK